MIEKTLQKLGFSTKEIAIYLALIELGTAKAGELAKISSITRTTVYDILDSLLKRGVISSHKKSGTTSYSALEPKRLLTYIDREIEQKTNELSKQKEEIASFLPELVSKQKNWKSKPKVSFFEGEKGVREAYEDTLSAKQGILAYANVQTMHEGLPNFFPQYYKRRADAKVFIKAILTKNKFSEERANRDQQELRTSKFLPEDVNFSPEVNIYNDKVLIASWKEKMAVIIESSEFADFQRAMHEQLWKQLPKHDLK